MSSSKSSRKHTGKTFSKEISGFDLFYQLTYMSATAAAGLSRSRVFNLARQLPASSAGYFKEIDDLVENLRYTYPQACSRVGERVKSAEMRSFLLRLSDALRSGEPLASFLAREAGVQGKNYSNEYERDIESLKKWNDGYTAITVSVALVVIINMVSTMIYPMGPAMMFGMVFTSAAAGIGVAWILSRAAPKEVLSVPLPKGSQAQIRCLKLFEILGPLTAISCLALVLLGVDRAWIMIAAALLLFPVGITSLLFDRQTMKKDSEIAAFLRSLGGTATSRGTTLGEALNGMEISSFPALKPDIVRLGLRLRASVKPEICWKRFGAETGSLLIDQTTGIFYEAINLGGDPEKAGILCSLFATKVAMLRAKRRGIAATFTWLLVVMHIALAAIMIFLLEIVNQFTATLNAAMATAGVGEQEMQSMAAMMIVSTPATKILDQMAIAMILTLVLANAFAIVATEGAHLLKISFYMSILLFLSGVCYLVVPPMVTLVM